MDYFVCNNAKSQAMLFLVMFGPPCPDNQQHYAHLDDEKLTQTQKVILNELNNHTEWESFTESVTEDFHEGKDMFYSLAQAICSCLSASLKWKREKVCDVLEAMFTTPSQWKRENVAGFLLFCSEGVRKRFLFNFSIKGHSINHFNQRKSGFYLLFI